MPKFKGLCDIASLGSNVICSSWCNVLDNLNSPAILSDESSIYIENKLDEHWNKIIQTSSNNKLINENILKRWKILLAIKNIPYTIKKQIKE